MKNNVVANRFYRLLNDEKDKLCLDDYDHVGKISKETRKKTLIE